MVEKYKIQVRIQLGRDKQHVRYRTVQMVCAKKAGEDTLIGGEVLFSVLK